MQEWHYYFQSRSTNRPQFTLPSRIVGGGNHDALIHSLQRFELGESGEGTHLKAVAARLGDPTYQQAISLFIREEQDHSQWLGAILDALGTPRLHWHWSDALFIMLRRRMGLKTEICVLLVAEMIAKRYYAALRDGGMAEEARRLFAQICEDEEGHLAFHTAFLTAAFRRHSAPICLTIWLLWWGFYRLACLAVLIDHRGILRQVRVPPTVFWRDTGRIFAGIVGQIFGGEGDIARRETSPPLPQDFQST